MNDYEKLSWSALEYEEKERSQDWFWALGTIVVTSSIASIIFGNYFFAVLLLLSGALLGFFSVKKPDMVRYELHGKGLQIRDRMYPYENIKSFWVERPNSENPAHKPTLFVHTERLFMPILMIPIEVNMAEEIHALFTEKNVPEVEMKEHPSDKIIEALGF